MPFTETAISTDRDGERAGAPSLPSFPGGELPEPEPLRRRLVVRGVALLTLAISIAYLTWRAMYTIDLGVAWIAIPFFVMEAHAVLSLALFTFSLWDVDSRPKTRPVNSSSARVAVLIPTYNESSEVLLPTIAAAVALKPEHETWVLDDGNRREVKELAERLGARYIARSENTHAKAGNINNALNTINADFVAILDADHVARPGFLVNTLGYFDDPRIALVQTPQEFYNLDSFEHEDDEDNEDEVHDAESSEEKDRYHEEGLFYRVIQPGKNRCDAAFWCGTGAVVRVAALRSIGGVATDTITEDIHTTVRMHRRGWKTVYHNEVLARGLAARTAAEYQLQRFRWGSGAMQLLRRENPLTVPGLTLRQRIAYAATLLGWFEAWRSLGYLIVPIAVLFTGAIPIAAPPEVFLPAFAVTLLMQQIALRVLSRGYHRLVLPIVFELVRMAPNIMAALTLVWPGKLRFQVTPKGRMEDGERRRMKTPTLLTAVLLASAAAAVWFFLTLAGLTPTTYTAKWAAYGAAFWLVLNSYLVVLAIRRIRSTRFGAERRASVRFRTNLTGTLDAAPCTIEDISLTGARASLDAAAFQSEPPPSGKSTLTVDLGDTTFHFQVFRRSAVAGKYRGQVGLEFVEGQEQERARLALALFNA